MRDVTDAHYLHVRRGLEAILRPPVKHPTAVQWVPRKVELLVTDRGGRLHHVDPVLGTRVLTDELGEAAYLVTDGKRTLVVCREGRWTLLEGSSIVARGRHPFLGGISALLHQEYAILVGDEVDGKRRMLILKGGKLVQRIRLPERVVPLVHSDRLHLGRATIAGLKVVRYGKKARFEPTPATQHRLRVAGDWVMGLTATGLAVWPAAGGMPTSLRLPDITFGDVHPEGQLVALGTRVGAVALARLGVRDRKEHPDLVKAFDGPVTAVSFATRGRWLATGAEALQIWSWE